MYLRGFGDHSVDEWRAEIPARHARLEVERQRDHMDRYARRYHEFSDRQHARFNDLQRVYTDIALEANPATLFAALLRSSQTSRALALGLSLDLDRPAVDRSALGFCCYSGGWNLDGDATESLHRCAALARAVGHLDRWSERCMTDSATLEPDLDFDLDELTPPVTTPQPTAYGLVTLDP